MLRMFGLPFPAQAQLQHLIDIVRFAQEGMLEGGYIYVYDDDGGASWGACVAVALIMEARGLPVIQAYMHVRERLPAIKLSTACQELLDAYRTMVISNRNESNRRFGKHLSGSISTPRQLTPRRVSSSVGI